MSVAWAVGAWQHGLMGSSDARPTVRSGFLPANELLVIPQLDLGPILQLGDGVDAAVAGAAGALEKWEWSPQTVRLSLPAPAPFRQPSDWHRWPVFVVSPRLARLEQRARLYRGRVRLAAEVLRGEHSCLDYDAYE